MGVVVADNIKKTTEVFQDQNKSQEAMFYLEQAGKVIRPHGYDYVGSFCIHIYEAKLTMVENYSFATQFVNQVKEQLAIEAAKELKERMLSRYGHELKKAK